MSWIKPIWVQIKAKLLGFLGTFNVQELLIRQNVDDYTPHARTSTHIRTSQEMGMVSILIISLKMHANNCLFKKI